MEKEGWLSFQQLWIRSRRASRSSSHLYVSPDYSFDNNKDNFHHDFRERTKLQYDTPHRNRKFLNIHIKHLTNKRQFYKINYNDTLASFLLYKHISSNRKFGHLIRKEKNFRLQKLNVWKRKKNTIINIFIEIMNHITSRIIRILKSRKVLYRYRNNWIISVSTGLKYCRIQISFTWSALTERNNRCRIIKT